MEHHKSIQQAKRSAASKKRTKVVRHHENPLYNIIATDDFRKEANAYVERMENMNLEGE